MDRFRLGKGDDLGDEARVSVGLHRLAVPPSPIGHPQLGGPAGHSLVAQAKTRLGRRLEINGVVRATDRQRVLLVRIRQRHAG
jgi:hypothetical protein